MWQWRCGGYTHMKLHVDVAPCVTARLISPTPIKQDVAAAELSVKMMVFQFVHVVSVPVPSKVPGIHV